MAFKIFSIDSLSDLKKLVVDTTLANGGAKSYDSIMKAPTESSELLKGFQAASTKGFHSYTKQTELVLKVLLKHLTGEELIISDLARAMPITKNKKTGNFYPFSLVVPIKNSNSHNYIIGDPILTSTSKTICFTLKGSRGNNINSEDCRYATMEEIDKFFDNVSSDFLDKIASHLS